MKESLSSSVKSETQFSLGKFIFNVFCRLDFLGIIGVKIQNINLKLNFLNDTKSRQLKSVCNKQRFCTILNFFK